MIKLTLFKHVDYASDTALIIIFVSFGDFKFINKNELIF